MELYKALCEISGEGNVLKDEPMKMHTTFRIGGPADYFIQPSKIEEIRRIVAVCRECSTPYYIMGNGSNLLVGDKGFRGVIVQVFKQMSDVYADGERVYAQAGALLSKTAAVACEASLTGMEFASGIPGTLGGALRMNAGAYGGEIKDVLIDATVLTAEGELKTVTRDELDLSYRHSIVPEKGYIVLSARFRLTPKPKDEIKSYMAELRAKRVEKQPLEYPSAGSTFKRPEGYFAGKLIMDAGLRGYSVGDAQVSQKHCGFVVNKGEATAADVLTLIKDVQETVLKQFGVKLEPEVKMIGEF